ncbi:MAG: GNAT family N-acetyltransferase [Nocardioides sp.]|uniref:GNAT family N-acetyltransferase n=1 Tax=Nocardioides sp. TaxID=35761 RepID=UPI0039E2835D
MGAAPGHAVGRHGLGAHVVGQRVVVRHLLPGQTGPSGGPAVTDVLGVCTSWDDDSMTVERADGSVVTISRRLIVSGKPVPSRPSVRGRVTPAEAHERAFAQWTDLTIERLGGWTLRRSATHPNRRANSVLAMTPAEVEDPIARVVEWYAAAGRPPIACVQPDSDEHDRFVGAGWQVHRQEADTLFCLAGVAAIRRQLVELPDFGVRLVGSGDRVEARIGEDARGQAAYSRDWIGLGGLEVRPERRRRGLGLAIMAALLDWGAEHGTTTAYLQVVADNAPAVALYDRLGFTTHHAYRYLAPGG